jgi:phage anti-repressor protein
MQPQIVNPAVALDIKKSKSTGASYVMARNLHAALQLNPVNYSRDVKQWFAEDYGFADDIRQPIEGQEYSSSTKSIPVKAGQPTQDYFIKLNLAKLITLNSRSPVKKDFARYLLSLEEKVENADLLSPEQVVAMMDVAGAMTLISCQEAAERQHYQKYLEEGNSKYDWWDHRAQLLGYTMADLREAMHKMGRNSARRNRRVMLQQTGNKHQTIREGVIDLFLALGKSTRYADNMGFIAFNYAEKMGLTIYRDKNATIDYTQALNQDLIKEIQALRKEGFMGLW